VHENTLSLWFRDERRRIDALEASSDVPLSVAERAEVLMLRREISEKDNDLAFLGKLPRTSPRRHQGREFCVDGGGVRELRDRPHGEAARGVPDGLLPLGRSKAP
jgi:hypothetical protein